MLYDSKLKQAMLDILENRISGVADVIQALMAEGYIPNKNKETILSWSIILLHAYENIDVFSDDQQKKLDTIFNKVMKL